MNRLLLLLLILIPYFCSAQETHFKIIESFETEECFISFIECSGNQYVVKQIKDPSPNEQFLLVIDALGCQIAEISGIPQNRVTIIPANVTFPGKKLLEFPATLHTFATGVCTEQGSFYKDIDIHQRFRAENSPMWRRYGPLPAERTGLTKLIIQAMARHPDLPKIVALDTFVGNADRSSPNLYYDESTDRFCGIDMAASFTKPLGLAACRQLKGMRSLEFTQNELSALMDYANTLESLIKNWPPEKIELSLMVFAAMAGFQKGNLLFDQDVEERIMFHKRCMRENDENCRELVKVIHQLVTEK